MDINEILTKIGSDVLTEDTKKLLTDAFSQAIDAKVNERLELEVTAALQKLDEQHSSSLEKLLGDLDRDHTSKLQAVLGKIDEDHTKKLEYVIERGNKLVQEDASTFKSQLVKQLSNYLDLYLEKAVPNEKIEEAVQNKQAGRIVNEIKKLVSIDEQFVNETVKEAVADGKKTIDTLKSELNEAIKDNIRLNQETKGAKASLILEQTTKDFSKEKKDYVMRVLAGKDPEYITENVSYVIKMFEKEEDDTIEDVAAVETKAAATATVETPALITEAKDAQKAETPVAGYLDALSTFDKKK